MVDRGQLLKTIYEALGRGDLETMRKHVLDDVEIVERLEVPGARVYHGIDDWEQGAEEEAETIGDFRVELLDAEEIGGRCVAAVKIRIRGKGSGAEVEERLAHLVDFEGERVSRWRAFSDLDDARATARVECIRELYELWEGGRQQDAIARVHPQIEWVEPAETIGAQERTGRERAREGIADWQGSFDSFEGDVRAVDASGDRVIVEYVQRVRAGGSSVQVETPVFHLWSFRDGVPARMAMFFERDQALNS